MASTEALGKRVKALAQRIDALKLNERVLMLGAAVLVTAYFWDKAFLQPLDAKRLHLVTETQIASEALQKIDQAAAEWVASASIDPDAEARARLEALGKDLALARGTVEAKAGRMVPPEQMPEVLKSVLSRFHELEFVSLEGLKVEQVAVAPPAAADSAPATKKAPDAAAQSARYGVYRHGIRVRFKGSYPAVTEYLKALETLPFGFYWDSVELETRKYPEIDGSLVVYTVSLGAGWIGV